MNCSRAHSRQLNDKDRHRDKGAEMIRGTQSTEIDGFVVREWL